MASARLVLPNAETRASIAGCLRQHGARRAANGPLLRLYTLTIYLPQWAGGVQLTSPRLTGTDDQYA
jgi:hypothetical protein